MHVLPGTQQIKNNISCKSKHLYEEYISSENDRATVNQFLISLWLGLPYPSPYLPHPCLRKAPGGHFPMI